MKNHAESCFRDYNINIKYAATPIMLHFSEMRGKYFSSMLLKLTTEINHNSPTNKVINFSLWLTILPMLSYELQFRFI